MSTTYSVIRIKNCPVRGRMEIVVAEDMSFEDAYEQKEFEITSDENGYGKGRVGDIYFIEEVNQ